MRNLSKDFVTCLICCSFLSTTATGQVEISTRLGGGGQPVGGGDASRNEQLRQGINQAFGGGNSGIISGSIGGSVPPQDISRAKVDAESKRSEEILRRWNDLQATKSNESPEEYLRKFNERKNIKHLINYKASLDPNSLRKWKSENKYFVETAAKTLFVLETSPMRTEADKILSGTGKEAVSAADSSFANGDKEAADFYLGLAITTADLLVGIDPLTGTFRAIYESVTGRNVITNQELSNFERSLAIFSVVTLGYGGEISKGIDLFAKVASESKIGLKITGSVVSAAKYLAAQFNAFRGSQKAEEAAARYIRVLMEATSGPRQRMQSIASATGDVGATIERNFPEIYQLENPKIANISLGSATRSEADALGRAFVGERATVSAYRQDPTKLILISEDGRRRYRPAFYKNFEGKYQANFEIFAPKGSPRTSPLSDGHLNILD